jgi:hypothetical protein
MRRPPFLAIAAFLGIGVPGFTLLLFRIEGWDLPTWLAVALPIILIGSTRGTAVILGWRGLRWVRGRLRARQSR